MYDTKHNITDVNIIDSFIGYGNAAPRTPEGKVLTMFYAVIGVSKCDSNFFANKLINFFWAYFF